MNDPPTPKPRKPPKHILALLERGFTPRVIEDLVARRTNFEAIGLSAIDFETLCKRWGITAENSIARWEVPQAA